MYELKIRDKELILEWNLNQTKTLEIQKILTGQDQDRYIENFCLVLNETAPLIKFIDSKEDEAKLPGIKLLDNIIFSSVPLEMELPPFLETLSWINNEIKPELSEKVQANLNRIEIPVSLKLYVAQQCPHCPDVVRTVIPLALACPYIFVTIVDGTIFTDEAGRDNVMSAPCLILDQDFRWTGAVSPEEITGMIADRDPSKLSTHSLKMILEDGKADWISDKIKEYGKMFPGFIGLVTHEIWSVRLGAMVVLEELAESAPELALSIVPELLERFHDFDLTVQGDILYALGEAGDLKVKADIRELMKKIHNSELHEAAQEAVESIESRF